MNQVEDVLHVEDPKEFAVRLREFAQAVAEDFFPGTVVEVKPAPTKDSQENAA